MAGRLQDVILYGTRAAQPLATAVATGTLYFVTVELVLERSNGTTWDSISPASAIANDAVTYAKIQNVTAASRLLGRGSAAGAGDPEELTIGAGLTLTGTALTADAGAGDWTTVAVKSADQDVTNSSTLVDAADMVIAVGAGSVWLIEVLLAYAGDSTAGDFKCGFATTVGTPLGAWHVTGLGSTGTPFTSAANFAGGTQAMKTDANVANIHAALLRGTVACPSAANVTFQFAQNTATVGTLARCKAGTTMRGKQII